jgi:hypothetical protein
MGPEKKCCEDISDSDVIRSLRSDVQDLRGDVSDLRARLTSPAVKAGAVFVLVSQILNGAYTLWRETISPATAAPATVQGK